MPAAGSSGEQRSTSLAALMSRRSSKETLSFVAVVVVVVVSMTARLCTPLAKISGKQAHETSGVVGHAVRRLTPGAVGKMAIVEKMAIDGKMARAWRGAAKGD